MSENSKERNLGSARRHVADMLYDTASRIASSKSAESHLEELPALSLFAFATSIMALGSRIMKVGKLELGLAEVFSWQRPAMTLTLLFAYTGLCYHPQWLVLLPLFYFVFVILIPNYAEKFQLEMRDANDYQLSALSLQTSRLGALPSPARGRKSEDKVKETKNLLKAIRQGQKALSGLVEKLDKIDEFFKGPARFEDVQVSSVMLLASFGALIIGGLSLMNVSIPFFFSSLGWGILCSKHPLAKLTSEKLEDFHIEPQLDIEVVKKKLGAFCRNYILIDDEPIKRRVQIFELQPQGLTARQWDTTETIYSTEPYLPGSPSRTQKQLPHGSHDLSDILPPDGWTFDIGESWVPEQDNESWLTSTEYQNALFKRTVQSSPEWVYDQIDPSHISNVDIVKVWRRRRLWRNSYYDI